MNMNRGMELGRFKADAGPGRMARTLRGFSRWTGMLLLLATIAFLGGFGLFAERISRSITPANIAPAEAIVVLTGGQFRLEAAFDLLAKHKAEHLLISGVHPDATENTLSRVTGFKKSLFDCCVDIGYEAKDTVGNAMETILWLRRNGYHSLILVTNNYHMPRSVLELRRIDPTLKIVPYPVVNSDLTDGKWLGNTDTLRVLLLEYMKYLGAKTRSILPVPASISAIY